jgi:hypothetical protein
MTDRETTEEEARHRFAERLGDWSEPGAITIIRNGVPLDPETGEERVRVQPTVTDVDSDGNLRMSDGTIRVPE